MKKPWNFSAVKWRDLLKLEKSVVWKEKNLLEFVREQQEKEEKRREEEREEICRQLEEEKEEKT